MKYYFPSIAWPKFSTCTWPEHWTNGGTGITKINPKETTLGHGIHLIESIKLFNDPDIWVNEKNEMHSKRDKPDLSDFWKFHRERTANQQTA